MIKVFNGGQEITANYAFQYHGLEDAYSSTDREIGGKLAIRDLEPVEEHDLITNLKGKTLVFIEGKQVGYMVNLLYVKEIKYFDQTDAGQALYELELVKRMKPRKAKEYHTARMNGNFVRNFSVNILISMSVEKIDTAGNIRMAQGTDIRYLWASDTKVPDMDNEIGKCRIETGDTFYITQTGGTNVKMQMPSKSGEVFPNGRVEFNSITGQGATLTGWRLEIN